ELGALGPAVPSRQNGIGGDEHPRARSAGLLPIKSHVRTQVCEPLDAIRLRVRVVIVPDGGLDPWRGGQRTGRPRAGNLPELRRYRTRQALVVSTHVAEVVAGVSAEDRWLLTDAERFIDVDRAARDCPDRRHTSGYQVLFVAHASSPERTYAQLVSVWHERPTAAGALSSAHRAHSNEAQSCRRR